MQDLMQVLSQIQAIGGDVTTVSADRRMLRVEFRLTRAETPRSVRQVDLLSVEGEASVRIYAFKAFESCEVINFSCDLADVFDAPDLQP
jgi:hypothetical protein